MTCRAPDCGRAPFRGSAYCVGHRSQRSRGMPLQPLQPRKYMDSYRKGKMRELRSEGWSDADIAAEMKISRQSVWSALRSRTQGISSPSERRPASDDLRPHPGQERCSCGLVRDKDHMTCDIPAMRAAVMAGGRP